MDCTLPATLRRIVDGLDVGGIVRVCSPVMVDEYPGVVVGFDEDGDPIVYSSKALEAGFTDREISPWALSRVSLDLANQTGEFHACLHIGLDYPYWLARIDGVVCLTDWAGQCFPAPDGHDLLPDGGVVHDAAARREALRRVVLAEVSP